MLDGLDGSTPEVPMTCRRRTGDRWDLAVRCWWRRSSRAGSSRRRPSTSPWPWSCRAAPVGVAAVNGKPPAGRDSRFPRQSAAFPSCPRSWDDSSACRRIRRYRICLYTVSQSVTVTYKVLSWVAHGPVRRRWYAFSLSVRHRKICYRVSHACCASLPPAFAAGTHFASLRGTAMLSQSGWLIKYQDVYIDNYRKWKSKTIGKTTKVCECSLSSRIWVLDNYIKDVKQVAGLYQQMSVKDRKYTLAGQYQQSTVEGNWRRTSAAAARKKNMELAWSHIEKKRWQHRQTGATADTYHKAAEEDGRPGTPGTRDVREWLFPFLPIPTPSSVTITIPIPFQWTYSQDGGGSTRQNWMESSALLIFNSP